VLSEDHAGRATAQIWRAFRDSLSLYWVWQRSSRSGAFAADWSNHYNTSREYLDVSPVDRRAIDPSPSYGGSYSSAEQAGIAGTEAKTGLTYTAGPCPSGQSCLGGAQVFGNPDTNLGLDAAYVQMAAGGSGGGAICDAYVDYDSAGWHVFPPVACVQQSGYNPVLGTQDHVQVPGGGCANVRQSPTLGAKVVTCLMDGTSPSIRSSHATRTVTFGGALTTSRALSPATI